MPLNPEIGDTRNNGACREDSGGQRDEIPVRRVASKSCSSTHNEHVTKKLRIPNTNILIDMN